MTKNQELNTLHVRDATAFVASTRHAVVPGDTLLADFIFFLHPVRVLGTPASRPAWLDWIARCGALLPCTCRRAHHMPSGLLPRLAPCPPRPPHPPAHTPQTAIGHWSEMLFPLFSILRQERSFARPPTQFLLLHLKRAHMMEWVRGAGRRGRRAGHQRRLTDCDLHAGSRAAVASTPTPRCPAAATARRCAPRWPRRWAWAPARTCPPPCSSGRPRRLWTRWVRAGGAGARPGRGEPGAFSVLLPAWRRVPGSHAARSPGLAALPAHPPACPPAPPACPPACRRSGAAGGARARHLGLPGPGAGGEGCAHGGRAHLHGPARRAPVPQDAVRAGALRWGHGYARGLEKGVALHAAQHRGLAVGQFRMWRNAAAAAAAEEEARTPTLAPRALAHPNPRARSTGCRRRRRARRCRAC